MEHSHVIEGSLKCAPHTSGGDVRGSSIGCCSIHLLLIKGKQAGLSDDVFADFSLEFCIQVPQSVMTHSNITPLSTSECVVNRVFDSTSTIRGGLGILHP